MTSWDNFLEDSPRAEHDQHVFRAVEQELSELRRQRRRRIFLAWTAPFALSALALVVWRQNRDEAPEDVIGDDLHTILEMDFEFGESQYADNFDLLEDLGLMEDLEVLEKWSS